MLRFGAYFGLLLGVAAILNGLFLIVYGERALPDGHYSRVPAIHSAFSLISEATGVRTGFLVEGAAWLLVGLVITVLCVDVIRPFLPKPRPLANAPLRDPVSEAFVSVAKRLAGLKGAALVAAVAACVAALSFLLLNNP